jgi:hypothetical protein
MSASRCVRRHALTEPAHRYGSIFRSVVETLRTRPPHEITHPYYDTTAGKLPRPTFGKKPGLSTCHLPSCGQKEIARNVGGTQLFRMTICPSNHKRNLRAVLTACVSGSRAGVDEAGRRDSAEARKLPENAVNPCCPLHAVLGRRLIPKPNHIFGGPFLIRACISSQGPQIPSNHQVTPAS